ncbi:MAG: hypothetical protein A2504_04920 [Bdellovibrionales bacterium RIFOXYD12_FULL_39_22]|nr:MAG: hypothetical protein A2385_06905 [Bdellovibrionales bacterium RIFOXYB1_FULL_39_21]OFZ41995.1 MAG: hypothetical protein A2485_08875 [Bdellovibrionales bacterium RIFOXYC12_FULL_39_17]OFZ50711.1 MAG: hypothetical protein A2404_05825 [Bdellovibrionales bacterium RIFOXYC1_FULL_39_130]OFZ76504.1 MAG: hypothetical protein A2451_10505 [Bdellovibrionales bacterium RIFOXYC2_FULL_39_8]OFZ77934.1 MAG: hypothetical protein A2560_00995 [Bdellovibrionales bacterium RIFOXYD1_FULL_39_84]OFZ93630.1 MAG:
MSCLLKKIILSFLLLFIAPVSSAFFDLSFMKLSFRFANGLFYQTNTLYSQGSTLALLSPDLNLLYFWNPRHSVGLGGDLYFNYTAGNIALYGMRGNYRWYFKGEGYPQKNIHPMLEVSSISSYAFYAGGALKKYEYYLGGNSSEESSFEQRGSFFDLDACVGIDYRIGNTTELNFELNFSLLALASTDDRIRMGNALVLFGIARWW